MSISFCVLGSGSSGNCTLVALQNGGEKQLFLIDAGLSPRRTCGLLAERGVRIDRIRAILLTHLDSDHFRPTWLSVARRFAIQIHLHESHCGIAPIDLRRFGHLQPMNGLVRLGRQSMVRTIVLPHDDAGTCGFLIEHAGCRFGFATDLGHVPQRLVDAFGDLHALAIESNYDHDLELASARPWFLKQRIMGDHGHLSNDQSLAAVLQIEEQSALTHIALLHLSRECNSQRIVQKLYANRARHILDRLTITSQHRPSPMLHIGPEAGSAASTLFEAGHVG